MQQLAKRPKKVNPQKRPRRGKNPNSKRAYGDGLGEGRCDKTGNLFDQGI